MKYQIIAYGLSLGVTLFFYSIFSCLMYVCFWSLPFFKKMRVDAGYSTKPRLFNELVSSVITLAVFNLIGFFLYLVKTRFNYDRSYQSISEHGWAYFVFSVFFMIFFADAYFYWTHRLSHNASIYKAVHSYHHTYSNPTPFAAYSSGFLEALIHGSSLLITLLIIPWHPLALLVYIVISIFYICFIHLGFDPLPAFFSGLLYSPSHHALHHTKYRYNYGLYFAFWDKLCGTELNILDSKKLD